MQNKTDLTEQEKIDITKQLYKKFKDGLTQKCYDDFEIWLELLESGQIRFKLDGTWIILSPLFIT